MRVFLGLNDIGGWHLGLYQGLRKIGVDAVYCSRYVPHKSFEDIEQQPFLARLYRKLTQWDFSISKNHIVPKIFARLITSALRIPIFVWAVSTCDVFIFGFSSGIVSLHEGWLLKLLGKKIIYVFHGSDARPPFIDATYYTEERRPIANKRARAMKKKIKIIERYANFCVNSPTTGHFFEKPFINWQLALGMPYVKSCKAIYTKKQTDGMVRVLHCPSHLEGKGSPLVRQIIAELKNEGLPIDFKEIHGRPHVEVLQGLCEADVVIDQTYSDLALSGFAVEAAHYGKAAVVGSYAQNDTLQIAAQNSMPVRLFKTSEELKPMIRELIMNSSVRELADSESFNFVSNEWSAPRIAERLLRLLRNDIPNEWWMQPSQVTYLEGFGYNRRRAAEMVADYLSRFGAEALFMNDKPRLKGAFIEFSKSGDD